MDLPLTCILQWRSNHHCAGTGMGSLITSRHIAELTHFSIFLLAFLLSSSFTATEAYDPLDPNGNITIKWDIMSWTPDGYVAVVTIFNYQRFRHIEAPGWTLGWTWAKKELIWATVGAKIKEQGDCSRYKGNIPASCKKDPQVVDLPRKTPYNMQTANCCRGGVISTGIQDPANSASSFQLSVGRAGNTNKTVLLPKNFSLTAPGAGYVCGAAKIVRPTRFISPDGRRMTQALMTWNVTCTSTQFLVRKAPTCCVALSAFYNKTVADCPLCSCGCHTRPAQPGRRCAEKDESGSARSVQCTPHMCPIRVHWDVELDLRKYWRVKVAVTNFNHRKNYSEWNLGIQHPNFDNLARAFGLNYKSLPGYSGKKDIAMLWGIKRYNSLLREAGRFGHVQGELLFRKDSSTFTLQKGWAFPRRVYFNGDSCVMPPPDAYPQLTTSV